MIDPQYEKLGWFYLGRPVDPAAGKTLAAPLLYDSRDLVTHALMVGMTGSGKTGLGVGLLEEAAIDGVPALVVDPKGDLADLLLTFPDLAPADFLPWVRAEEAERKGLTREALAAAEAEKWAKGLASWGQDGERIRRLKEAAGVRLYTPGAELATPISILASFAAPPRAILDDADLFRDRVETAATSLLALAGIDADPLRSREHILISNLLSEGWRGGMSHDLASLIAGIQQPPFRQVGVMAVDTFFPPSDRFALALRINNLLAAPGFEVWTQGAPLDVGRLLHDEAGRPQVAVVSLAHLSEAERMFFVSLLLNETVAWMRTLSGTSSLRALLYMDEVFGYLPPVANPPSKKPMLTLLKQARAYGLGVALATQNPVDLDYKALSNIGTWFLGRLQTERDKARVLDGLEGASATSGATFDRAAIDTILSGLGARRFLLHNVHEDAPVLFETRWAMSYLAGPLDREQIRSLAARDEKAGSDDGKTSRERGETAGDLAEGSAAALATGGPVAPRAPVVTAAGASRPILAPGIPQVFFPPSGSLSELNYEPALLGSGRVAIDDAKRGIRETIDCSRLARFAFDGSVDWSEAAEPEEREKELTLEPAGPASFGDLPAAAQKAASYSKWEKELGTALYRSVSIDLLKSPSLDEESRPGESERDFRIRLRELARERRDAEVEKIRAKFAPKLATLDERIRKAEARVEVESQQASSQKMSAVLAGAASVAGMLFGRRRLSATNVTRVGTAMRSIGRTGKESADVDRARDTVEALREQRAALDAEVESAIAAAGEGIDPLTDELETVAVRPRKSDVETLRVALAWIPRD